MTLGFGHNAWIGVGSESTYGTPLARLQFLEINSESMAAEDDVVVGNSVYNSAVDVDNLRQGRKTVGGGFTFDMRRTGWELLLKSAMGTVAFDALGAGGTSIQRTYTIPDALGTSLCLEVNRDAASFLYEGVMVNSFTISGNNDGILQFEVGDTIAETEGTVTVTSGTDLAAFSISKYWMFQDAVFTYLGTTKSVIDWSITVNQNLTDDRYFHGSRFTAQPKRADKLEVTGEMSLEFDGTAEWNAFQSAGTYAFAAVYTGDTLDGTVTESFVVNAPYVRLSKAVPNVSDSGRITYTVPFVAYANGTEKPANIVTVNSTGSTAGY